MSGGGAAYVRKLAARVNTPPATQNCFFRLSSDSFCIDHLSTQKRLKDGAYYCYCAYVLLISRYSDFLSPMPTNTGIFLRGLKLSGESRS